MWKWFLLTNFVWCGVAYAEVKNLDRKTSIAVISLTNNFDFKVEPTDSSKTREVQYGVNTPALQGVQVTFRGLTVAYLGSMGLGETSIETKGKTSYEDIRGALFLGNEKQFILLGHYNRYKGFYIRNTPQVDPQADLYLKRTDVETFNSGGALMYVISPKRFSASAAYVQSDRQTKSGGSFLVMAAFNTNQVQSAEDLVPDEIEDDFGAQKNLHKVTFVTTALSGGYSHSFIWRKLFLNLTGLFGRGPQHKKYLYDGTTKSETGFASKYNIGLSLGFNGDIFFVGGSMVQDFADYEAGSLHISPTLASTRWFLGFRF